MMVGSKMTDVMSVTPPDPKEIKEEEKAAAAAAKEPLCKQKVSQQMSPVNKQKRGIQTKKGIQFISFASVCLHFSYICIFCTLCIEK